MSNIQTLADLLTLFPQKPRQKTGRGWNVICPAHDDRNPSLSISRNGTKLLLHCQAGCPVEAILGKLGLSFADLELSAQRQREVDHYDYHNSAAQLIYQVVRYEPKGFSVRRPDGKGGFIKNLGSNKPVLYRLPDILLAREVGDLIYIPEGEKDANSLLGIGLVATTSPFGAKAEWEKSYTDTLSGARAVIVLADNDENNVGLKYAISKAEALNGKVGSLKLITFPDAEDVSDWLSQGHNRDDLEHLVKETPEYNISLFNVIDNTNINMSSDNENRHETGQVRDKNETHSAANRGDYARKFDDIMQKAGGRLDKREVAEAIGLRAADDTFRKLLSRRKADGKVRPYRGSHFLIEWVNRDYTVTQLENPQQVTFLDLELPLEIHKLARIPQGAVVGVAGYTSAGKTAFLLETAELNALSQTLPIYYWYHEMSESKMVTRCEDFPLLFEAQKKGKFFPVKQGDWEFADVLKPDAINLVDYWDRDDNLYLIGEDIKKLHAQLHTGVVIFALQMKHGNTFGYGGLPSAKLANLYVTLDVKKEHHDCMRGIAKIIKCKDWADMNPVDMSAEYYTGGRHGRLFLDGTWTR